MQETQETWVQSLGWEDALKEEMANHSTILAWKIPWMEEPGRLQSLGSQRVGHDTVTSFSLSSLTPGSFFSALFATSQGQGMLAPDRELLSGLLSSAQSLRRVRLFMTPWAVAHGIFQAKILEWFAISFSRGFSRPRDRTHLSSISCIGRQVLYH